jgi:hypothetical protein
MADRRYPPRSPTRARLASLLVLLAAGGSSVGATACTSCKPESETRPHSEPAATGATPSAPAAAAPSAQASATPAAVLRAEAEAEAALAAHPAPEPPTAIVTTDRNGRLRANTADLPGRCGADRSTLNYTQPAFASWQAAFHASNPADAIIDKLAHDDTMTTGHVYPGVNVLAGFTRYPERRQEIQDLFESKFPNHTGEELSRYYHAYAIFLLYNGEFKKIISFFEPDTRPGRPHVKDGPIHFVLSQAYHRLGMYEPATAHAKIAFALKDSRDTRWQFMLSELGLYGDDFYTKASADLYDIDHVKEIFPNHDRSRVPFEDVTDQMHIERWGGTGSTSFADFDNDGWDDLLLER